MFGDASSRLSSARGRLGLRAPANRCLLSAVSGRFISPSRALIRWESPSARAGRTPPPGETGGTDAQSLVQATAVILPGDGGGKLGHGRSGEPIHQPLPEVIGDQCWRRRNHLRQFEDQLLVGVEGVAVPEVRQVGELGVGDPSRRAIVEPMSRQNSQLIRAAAFSSASALSRGTIFPLVSRAVS